MKKDIDISSYSYYSQAVVQEAVQLLGQTVWYSNLHQRRFVKTLDIIKSHIDLTKNPRILEIGSWPGYLTVALHKTGAQITATDLKPERTKILKQFNIPAIKIDLHHSQSLPLKKTHYDCIVFCEIIEHLNPQKITEIILRLKEVLKPDGVIILTTPNKFCFGNLLRFRIQGSKRTNKSGHGHWKEYSQKEIELYFENCGMKICESKLINFYSLIGKSNHNSYFCSIFSFLGYNNKLHNLFKIVSLPVRSLIPVFRDSIIAVIKK
ncbi:MAG: class I SAM-dependent methyltransferase [Candidatus Pacebacteria bacterium]|nr:class I SAM-dependent methyltransferase [Candidatus Paceibacterota bacterium]